MWLKLTSQTTGQFLLINADRIEMICPSERGSEIFTTGADDETPISVTESPDWFYQFLDVEPRQDEVR